MCFCMCFPDGAAIGGRRKAINKSLCFIYPIVDKMHIVFFFYCKVLGMGACNVFKLYFTGFQLVYIDE